MDDNQLGESTLSINNRTLIRYTLDDAKEAINLIRDYESNTKKILAHTGIVTREDLLD
jgi:DNA gyrase/topoisomerase IV subunit B